ncbi:MAG: hypothetical protein M1838_002083 [Thelocarpon superellum]|nr:MAG: hypothetical protein M1838_002083 [Thelocarpon superellum]
MTPRLDSLPAELADQIMSYLDLGDVSSVRLASRVLQLSCAERRFRDFFASRRVSLSEESLQTLVELTAHRVLGPAVRKLSIIATVHDTTKIERQVTTRTTSSTTHTGVFFGTTTQDCTEEEMAQARLVLRLMTERKEEQARMGVTGLDVRLLTMAFRNLGRLAALSLSAEVYQDLTHRALPERGGAWRPIWERASATYRVVLTALAQSHLAVERLGIFDDVRRCSVPVDEIHETMSHAELDGLRHVLAHVRVLSLSFSSRLDLEGEREVEAEGEEDNEEVSKAPAQLLGLASELEELDLHVLQPVKGKAMRDLMCHHILTSVPLPKLCACRLRGVHATEDSLKEFLHNCPGLDRLELRDFCLDKGTWTSVFQQLAGETCGVSSLTFSFLYERTIIEFDKSLAHLSERQYSSARLNQRSLKVNREQLQHGIRYAPSRARLKASAETYRMYQQRQLEYGSR